MKKILLKFLFSLADILVTAVVKVVSGSTVPKRFIQELVKKAGNSDLSGEEKLAAVKQLIADTGGQVGVELDALPGTLKNLIIEIAVAKLKNRVGQLQRNTAPIKHE